MGRVVTAEGEDGRMVDPKHPHAWIDIDHVPHPAIVIEWMGEHLSG